MFILTANMLKAAIHINEGECQEELYSWVLDVLNMNTNDSKNRDNQDVYRDIMISGGLHNFYHVLIRC